jgi:hypothetical protein
VGASIGACWHNWGDQMAHAICNLPSIARSQKEEGKKG